MINDKEFVIDEFSLLRISFEVNKIN